MGWLLLRGAGEDEHPRVLQHLQGQTAQPEPGLRHHGLALPAGKRPCRRSPLQPERWDVHSACTHRLTWAGVAAWVAVGRAAAWLGATLALAAAPAALHDGCRQAAAGVLHQPRPLQPPPLGIPPPAFWYPAQGRKAAACMPSNSYRLACRLYLLAPRRTWTSCSRAVFTWTVTSSQSTCPWLAPSTLLPTWTGCGKS